MTKTSRIELAYNEQEIRQGVNRYVINLVATLGREEALKTIDNELNYWKQADKVFKGAS